MLRACLKKRTVLFFQNRKKENDRNMFGKTGKGKMTKTFKRFHKKGLIFIRKSIYYFLHFMKCKDFKK